MEIIYANLDSELLGNCLEFTVDGSIVHGVRFTEKDPNPRFTRHLDKITKSLVGEQRICLVLYPGQQDNVSIPAEVPGPARGAALPTSATDDGYE